jgi:hypothetical protein
MSETKKERYNDENHRKKMNAILHNAKPAADSNHKLIQEFKTMTALSLYLKADKAKLAKFRKSGELFRDLYKTCISQIRNF